MVAEMLRGELLRRAKQNKVCGEGGEEESKTRNVDVGHLYKR